MRQPRCIVAAFAIGFIAWSPGCFNPFDDVSESTYSTFAEAEREQATARGWIPDFVPHSASEIIERHWLDSNMQIVEFSFDEEDLGAMLETFEGVSGEARRSVIERIEGPPWSRMQVDDSIRVYKRSDTLRSHGYLAINPLQKRAQYWNE
jgi:hypothetical protein